MSDNIVPFPHRSATPIAVEWTERRDLLASFDATIADRGSRPAEIWMECTTHSGVMMVTAVFGGASGGYEIRSASSFVPLAGYANQALGLTAATIAAEHYGARLVDCSTGYRGPAA